MAHTTLSRIAEAEWLAVRVGTFEFGGEGGWVAGCMCEVRWLAAVLCLMFPGGRVNQCPCVHSESELVGGPTRVVHIPMHDHVDVAVG